MIELAAQTTSTGFVSAAAIEKSPEDLLIDGAVDQTHAFNRQTFIQLTAAKIEQADQLANDVTDTNQYVMQCIQ